MTILTQVWFWGYGGGGDVKLASLQSAPVSSLLLADFPYIPNRLAFIFYKVNALPPQCAKLFEKMVQEHYFAVLIYTF